MFTKLEKTDKEVRKLYFQKVWEPICITSADGLEPYLNNEFMIKVLHCECDTYIAVIYKDRSDAYDPEKRSFKDLDLQFFNTYAGPFFRHGPWIAIERHVFEGPVFWKEQQAEIHEAIVREVNKHFAGAIKIAEKKQLKRARNKDHQATHREELKAQRKPTHRDVYRAVYLAVEELRTVPQSEAVKAVLKRIGSRSLDYLEHVGFDREKSRERKRSMTTSLVS